MRIQVRFGICTLNGNNGLGRIDGEFSSESLNCPGRSDESAAILAAPMERTGDDVWRRRTRQRLFQPCGFARPCAVSGELACDDHGMA